MSWNHSLSWLTRFASRSSRRRLLSPSGRYRPCLETLEDRWVPTTVSNLQDSGIGSLRDAINITPSGGTVNFAQGLTGTITLFTDELAIFSKDLNIQGPGANLLTISGNNNFRVFDIFAGKVIITGLTMTNGNPINSIVSPPYGGGVFNEGGQVTLNNDIIKNGQVTTPVSTQRQEFFFAGGGGIYNTFGPTGPGQMTLNNSVVMNNVGVSNYGAGIFNGTGGGLGPCILTLNNSVVTGNSGTDVSGAGLYNLGTATLMNTTLSNNVTSVSRNPGLGAGIFNKGTLTITQSTISGNVGPNNGGGIYSVAHAPFPVTATLTITNSTIANNKANNSSGGGIYISDTTLTILNSTIAGNTSSRGGGIYIVLGNIPQVKLTNTIVATNVAPPSPDVEGSINSSTNSLYGSGMGLTGVVNGQNGNQVGTGGLIINPQLGVLQNNGGPTFTMALLVIDSPAVDKGTNIGVPTVDQRGFKRNVNGTVDIGAYEFQPPATMTVLTSTPNPSAEASPVTFNVTVTGNASGSNIPAGTVTFRDGNTVLGTGTLDATGKTSFSTSGLSVGIHGITATYNGFVLGDYKFSSSMSSVLSQTVLKKTATVLTAAPNPSNVNDSVQLTATVTGAGGQPTGMVSFFDNGTPLGNGTLNNGMATFTAVFTTPGTHPLTATYNADSSFGTSTSQIIIQSVGLVAFTITALPNPSNVNDPITFTVTVNPVVSSSTQPTGFVDLFQGSKLLATGSLNGGTTQITLPANTFTAGTIALTARYEGDANYFKSTSPAFLQTVGATTTSLMLTPPQSSVGDTVTLTATVAPLVPSSLTPAGSVEFFDGTHSLGMVNLNGGTATKMVSNFTAGIHPIKAVYTSADTNFTGSFSMVMNETVGPTMTTVVTIPSTSNVNQTVTFTATVVAVQSTSIKPSGTVNFYDGTTLLGSASLDQNTGKATFTYSKLNAGVHTTITATYMGDMNFAMSTSPTVTQTVNKTGTSTSLSLNPVQPIFTQTTVLTATITPNITGSIVPAGTLSFFDNGTFLATVNVVNGVATYSTKNLPFGPNVITASYLGDGNFTTSMKMVTVNVKPLTFFAVGGSGRVLVYRPDNSLVADFAPYGSGYTGPINVALGDISGDGIYDLVTAAAVGNPDVRVYDGKALANGTFDPANPDASLLAQWFAYGLDFNVGATVAVGDINGNGFADVVTGADVGNPDVHVYSGKDIATHNFNPDGSSLLVHFFAYGLSFNIGANVAVGDVNNDGFADLITGATAGNPDVRVYNGRDIAQGTFSPDGASLLTHFFAYGLDFNVGAFVAVGDTTGSGFADIITGASIGNPDVHVYSGQAIAQGTFDGNHPENSERTQFFAYGQGSNIGATVAASDIEHTGRFDILTGPTAGTPTYKVFRGTASGLNPPEVFEGTPADIQDGLSVGG
jgi:hypothetical protein